MNSLLRRYAPFLVIAILACTFIPTGSESTTKTTFSKNGITITSHVPTQSELSMMMGDIGVYEEGQNYNELYNGHGTGLAPPTLAQWDVLGSSLNLVDSIATTRLDGNPSSIDHSQSIHFPPIGSQGSEGSCVAWAVGYYTKTFQEAKEHGWDLSGAVWNASAKEPTPEYQQYIMSPDFIYHQINNGISGNGAYYSDAIDITSSIGVSSWETMPYSDTDAKAWPSEAAWREAALYRGDDSAGYCYYFGSVTELKNLLAGGNLGVISINHHYYADLTNNTWTLDNYNTSYTTHANTVVGYDDSYTYMEGGVQKSGAFKVVNSWGSTYSSYWISYECMRKRVGKFFFYYDRTDYQPQALAVFEIDHAAREELFNYDNGYIIIEYDGSSKYFGASWLAGGAFPFPNNKIVLDITELGDITGDVTMHVYDGGGSTTGVIESFCVEKYINGYSCEGVYSAAFVSDEAPKTTVQGDEILLVAEYDVVFKAPDLITPSDGATRYDANPTFAWTEEQYATGYYFEIATAPDTYESGAFFEENIIATYPISGVTTETSYALPFELDHETTYYWHVQAYDCESQPSPWSYTRGLTITDMFTLTLNPGWNLISFPFMPSDSSLLSAISPIIEYIDVIYRWNGSQYEYCIPNVYHQFENIDIEHGFWIYNNSVADVQFSISYYETSCSTQITLDEGWNLVCWHHGDGGDIDAALGDAAQYIDLVYAWDAERGTYNFNQIGYYDDIHYFEPGKGYWIHATESIVWDG